MKTLIVKLWGKEIGRLAFLPNENLIQFAFNPKLKNRPDFAPILCPVGKWNPLIPYLGERNRLYHGLPPFIADSLPDSWGNSLFEKWMKKHKISIGDTSPLHKLTFIGKRGMGALEYEPSAEELEYSKDIGLNDLYECALKINDERESLIEKVEDITFETLIAVGTSAGGRQMKAIVAINPSTGEIRSGQITGLKDFNYYIIKFEDSLLPSTEIEMAYYEMAKKSGIRMEDCRIISVDGKNHFLTKRFDRKNGEKIHMQTLAAIDPDVKTYDQLFLTCRKLGLSEKEISELFSRMVFNIMANNTDDHIKNFSFLMEKGGRWQLSPAYDLTFIFNQYATGPEFGQCLSLHGKFKNITKEDVLEFAEEFNICGAENRILKVADAIKEFPQLAEKYKIGEKWRFIIQHTLDTNLINWGFKQPEKDNSKEISVKLGKEVQNFNIKLNVKGNYVISFIIDGKAHKFHIRKKMKEYAELQKMDIYNLSVDMKITLINLSCADSK